MRGWFSQRAVSAALAAAFAVFLAMPAVAQTPPDAEAIVAFDSAVTVEKGGGIAVVERITYRFDEPRHGIYRDIPFRYDEGGKTLEAPVTVTGVTDDAGAPLTTDVERQGNYQHVRIGDPDRYVSGTRVYVISYRVDGALKYFADHDELYWDATGTGWSVPILASTATVTLPESITADAVKATCYTGEEGSTAQACTATVEKNTVRFAQATEGPLTVVVGWPTGVVAKLEAREIKPPAYVVAAQKFFTAVGEWYYGLNPETRALFWTVLLLLPVILPIRAFTAVWRDWQKFGRDPSGRATLVVEYEPPDKISPAEAEALIDELAGNKGVWATLIDLAVRGYLTIKEVDPSSGQASPDYEFTLIKDAASYEALRPHELLVVKALWGIGWFAEPGSASMRTKLSEAAKDYRFEGKGQAIREAVYQSLVGRGYYDERPDKVRAKYAWRAGSWLFLGLVGGMPYLFALMVPGMWFLLAVPALLIAAGIVGLVVAPKMTRRTPEGVAAFEKLAGFREYMDKAERYRSRWQAEQGMFERYLPFAVAFGVVDKWSTVFEGMPVAKPAWYDGRAWRDGAFDSRAFSRSFDGMRSSFSRAATAMRPSSSSSGSGFSSGGGSSGGGRGGGGGGSW